MINTLNKENVMVNTLIKSPAFRKMYKIGVEKANVVAEKSVLYMMERILKNINITNSENGARNEI